MNIIRICLIGMILLAYSGYSANIAANTNIAKSEQIKAGFLLHFASFVKWPTESDTINICIVGRDPFGTFLKSMLETRPTNRQGNRVTLRRLQVGQDVSHCQILFVTQQSVNSIFWKTLPPKHSILLVSDYKHFEDNGGIVFFFEKNKRLRIAVNLEEARKHNLHISSELLKLVKITSN